MSLSLVKIKHYMIQVKMTTLSNLCQLFQSDPDTLRCLLSHWMRKGCIRQCMKKPACGSKCFQCPVADVEMYEWVEPNIGMST